MTTAMTAIALAVVFSPLFIVLLCVALGLAGANWRR